jgi:PAS domain S-box-containing protein
VRREFARIGGMLLGALVVLFSSGEWLERLWLGETAWSSREAFHLVRGGVTAIVLALLASWLVARAHLEQERALRVQAEQNDRMRRFFENIVQDAGEAIICLDSQGTVRSWNRTAEEIYGYSAEEMVGHTIERVVPQDLLAAGEIRELQDRVIHDGFVRDYETRRVRKDGKLRRVRITRTALRDPDGRIIGSTAIVRDITVEKEMEARLAADRKLAAVGEAAAGIAHEVRNALAGISGAIQVLKRNAAWRDLPEGFGEEVDFQVARIARILNDFLEYARPGELRLQPADLNKIVDHALARATNGTPATAPAARRDYALGEVMAVVDPGWLEQAVAQLLTNALQAMGHDGVLTASTRRDGDHVLLAIADTGCGMSPETLERAFEPFYTTKVRGTGMGLPIVRTIVEAHRGRVEIESAPGRGTTVTLVLPAAPGDERHVGRRAEREVAPASARAQVA